MKTSSYAIVLQNMIAGINPKLEPMSGCISSRLKGLDNDGIMIIAESPIGFILEVGG
jgi:hypothetical protein